MSLLFGVQIMGETDLKLSLLTWDQGVGFWSREENIVLIYFLNVVVEVFDLVSDVALAVLFRGVPYRSKYSLP